MNWVSRIRTYTYDSDTLAMPAEAIRSAGSIVVTKPRCKLHLEFCLITLNGCGSLKTSSLWLLMQSATYRGCLVPIIANVLRRLHRICEFYGSRPQFICTSATIQTYRNTGSASIGARDCN